MPDASAAEFVIPEPLCRRLAETTVEALDIIEALDHLLWQAKRLTAAVEVIFDSDDAQFEEWTEATGLRDLHDIICAIQGQTSEFTHSEVDAVSRDQLHDLVARVRGNVAARRKGLSETAR